MGILALEDGRTFYGEPFGASGTVYGEVVFNTGITGYQEVLTDPSYAGQIVVMTYPHIGNYGVTSQDQQANRPHLSGFVVREYSRFHSNWRAETDLETYMNRHRVIGLTEVDTRALTRHIRDAGAMRSCLSNEVDDPNILVINARRAPHLAEQPLVARVTCDRIYGWKASDDDIDVGNRTDLHVVAYDFGVKHEILRQLKARVQRVTVVPARTSARTILRLEPDGVFLSNGPGDPAVLDGIIANVKQLVEVGNLPIFGICLGHQILCLALGARSYKLKFGHRGSNQPVRCLDRDRIDITTHNHGYAIQEETLPDGLELTHVNLNDDTVEGVRHRELPIFSVQYHPEATPGPHDAHYLFDEFVTMIERSR
ncbi:MAG: glutamine-hydrolyzing carbamoyl-phosphate synthase small subunit [Candidatus Bipolaricaulia bacterium]